MKKAIITALLAIALPLVSQAQRQTFNLPAYFATNVFLSDNTNTPLHNRIQAIEQTNTDAWATFPATTNLNLAGFGASNVNDIAFDTAPSGSVAAARMQWNPDMETVRLGLDAAVSLDIGQQHVAFVRNAESVTISNGTVVYISGASGDKAEVKIASYSNDTLSARTIGIAAENITAGNTGFVVTRGPVYAQDTSAFTAGAMLYLGAYGNVTTNRPSAPLHGVFIGVVEKVNANAGVIFVAVQNGFELDELHDVNVAANTTNHLIISQGAVWTNMAIGSGLGVTGNQLVVTNVGAVTFEELTGNRMLLGSGTLSFIETNAIGAAQFGNFGNVKIGSAAYGASQHGVNNIFGSMEIKSTSYGASQRGEFSSPATIGSFAPGAMQIGKLTSGSATNNGAGAIQLIGGGGTYLTTSSAGGSLLLGPGTNDVAYSVKASGGFYGPFYPTTGNAANLTNFPSSILTVSAGNTNYARRTTVPASNTAFGSYNQWALDNTNLYFYNAASSKWLKVNGTLEW